MKKNLVLIFFCLLILSACDDGNKTTYNGTSLDIAFIGDKPKFQNENINFESISLDTFVKNPNDISDEFDALMITPKMFEEASQDEYVDAYLSSEMPIIFFDSSKGHYPFVFKKINYQTATDPSVNNIAHTTIFLNNIDTNRDDTWFFDLNEKNDLDALYTEVFNKIEEL